MNAGIADRAMQAAFSKIRPGMTEKELAADIRAHFASEGAAPAFWIVGAGGNGAFPHHSASERVIEEGDAVVIDIGGRKQGFPSDITRMAIVGRAPEGYGQIHTIVERAVQAALKAARPGVLAKEVDAAARKVISDAGYGEYFVHRTGHGMGIDGHEPPYITATSETVLEEGMVFSIEPGIYLPGRFGIRLEDIVILREDGPEVLSSLPATFTSRRSDQSCGAPGRRFSCALRRALRLLNRPLARLRELAALLAGLLLVDGLLLLDRWPDPVIAIGLALDPLVILALPRPHLSLGIPRSRHHDEERAEHGCDHELIFRFHHHQSSLPPLSTPEAGGVNSCASISSCLTTPTGLIILVRCQTNLASGEGAE